MEELITLCGDDCLACPRYTSKGHDELQAAARLWHRAGWRERIVSDEEIQCFGCSSHKECTYHLVECVKERGVEKCNQCTAYPCEKIKDMLERTEESKKVCRQKCSEQEFEILNKAFFNKEINLMK